MLKCNSCVQVTLCNHNGKKVRDIGLTCSHLSNILPEYYLDKDTGMVLTLVHIFVDIVNYFYHCSTSGCGKIVNYGGLRQMRLISFQ